MDDEKNEMNDTDIAALHHFYSRHLDFPDNAALTELFAQVKFGALHVFHKMNTDKYYLINFMHQWRNAVKQGIIEVLSYIFTAAF